MVAPKKIRLKSPVGIPSREILKVRKVGETLVVTLPQAVAASLALTEGARVLMETIPPKRIIITKEERIMPATQRIELEMAVIQRRYEAAEAEIALADVQHELGYDGMDGGDAALLKTELIFNRDKIAVELAEKRLELFDLQGS